MITVRTEAEAFRRSLGGLLLQTQRPRSILQAAARGVRGLCQRHFTERNKTPNKLGGERTHFWLEVYKSTQLGPVTDTSSTVVIGDSRFAQKVNGGPILAKHAAYKARGFKLLSIPVVPEAHGKRSRVFEQATGLKLFFMGNASGGVLATKAEGQGIRVIYAMSPRANQAADPAALPAQSILEESALRAAQRQLQSEMKARNPQ